MVPAIEDEEDFFKKRQKKKRDRQLEQKKKLEIKQLRRRLKKAKGGERKVITEKLERIESKRLKIEEASFDVMVKTIANRQKAQRRKIEEKEEEGRVRDELVERGLMDDKIHMNAKKYRMDGPELQTFFISTDSLCYGCLFSFFGYIL